MTNKSNDSEGPRRDDSHNMGSGADDPHTQHNTTQESTPPSDQSVIKLLSDARGYEHTITAVFTALIIVVFHLIDKESLAARAQAFVNPPDTETDSEMNQSSADDNLTMNAHSTQVGSPPRSTRPSDEHTHSATSTATSDGGDIVSPQYVGAVRSNDMSHSSQNSRISQPDESSDADSYTQNQDITNDRNHNQPAHTGIATERGRNSRNETHSESRQQPQSQTQTSEPKGMAENQSRQRNSSHKPHLNSSSSHSHQSPSSTPDSRSRPIRENSPDASQSTHNSESRSRSRSQSDPKNPHRSNERPDNRDDTPEAGTQTAATRTKRHNNSVSEKPNQSSIDREENDSNSTPLRDDVRTGREHSQADAHENQTYSDSENTKLIADPQWQVSVGLFTIVWAFASGLYGAGDTVTTFYALATGAAVETNPIIRTALNIHPGVVIIVKAIILAGLYTLSRSVVERGEVGYHSHISVMIPVLLGGVGTYASFVNMQSLPAELFVYVILSIIFIGFAGGAIVALIEGIPLTASELSEYKFGQALRDSETQSQNHSAQENPKTDSAGRKGTRSSAVMSQSGSQAQTRSGVGTDQPNDTRHAHSRESSAGTQHRSSQSQSQSRMQPQSDNRSSRDTGPHRSTKPHTQTQDQIRSSRDRHRDRETGVGSPSNGQKE